MLSSWYDDRAQGSCIARGRLDREPDATAGVKVFLYARVPLLIALEMGVL